MFLTIVIVAVVICILFCVILASLIGFIYNSINKNDTGKKKSLKILLSLTIVWVVLIGGDIALIVNYVSKNGEEILENAARISANVAGTGLSLTVQEIEKNWDKNRLQQLQNLSISLAFIDYEVQGETKVYDIEFILDNQSPAETKLWLNDLIGNNYLSVCDKDDFAYPIPLVYKEGISSQSTQKTVDGASASTIESSEYYSNTIIPFGKSKFSVNVTVPLDVEITHARYIRDVIKLK